MISTHERLVRKRLAFGAQVVVDTVRSKPLVTKKSSDLVKPADDAIKANQCSAKYRTSNNNF